MLDRVLNSSCPHDPATWQTAPTAAGELLTSEDYRRLTPLAWAHVTMHGEIKLNMNSRLDLGHASP